MGGHPSKQVEKGSSSEGKELVHKSINLLIFFLSCFLEEGASPAIFCFVFNRKLKGWDKEPCRKVTNVFINLVLFS